MLHREVFFIAMKTIRVRKSRPSALALALALMLTMLLVYLVSLTGARPEASSADARAIISDSVRLDGLETCFISDGEFPTALEARIRAAQCAARGGAGLVLCRDGRYIVARDAVNDTQDAAALRLGAGGVTLQLRGQSGDIAAVSEAVAFLRAQATETGALAAALESGETDRRSVQALIAVYQTRGRAAAEAMSAISSGGALTSRITQAVCADLSRLDNAAENPDAGKIRLIHAGACREWISLIEDMRAAQS